MVQVPMLICGVALGLKASSWKQAVTITLVVFAVALAVQTPLVDRDGGLETAGDVIAYVVIQAVSLAVGLGIARFLMRRRARQTASA